MTEGPEAANRSNKRKTNIIGDAHSFVESADAIIIGAGMGGLSAAAYLAQAGRRVIVLEQDHHLGGTAHVFRRGGFTFPTGPQSVTMPSYISDSLSELGVEQPPGFIRDCFQVRRDDMDVVISVPLDQLAKQLLDNFPKERKGILSIINILEEVMAALDGLELSDLIEPKVNCSSSRLVLERWGSVSAKEFLDRHLQDERLKELLGSQGTSETEMPVVLLAEMWRFMSKVGIWYVKGRIDAVPQLFAARVRAFGGEIRLGERVKRILVRDGAAAGVELAGGAWIKSPVVISDADYRRTILELLPPGAITAHEKEEVSRMRLTSSDFTVFLGVKRENVDLSAFSGNHLLVKLREGRAVPWEQKRPCPEDFLKDDIWLSWWSRHDTTLAPQGFEALIIKVDAPFDYFAHFSGGGRGCHHEYYYSMKEEMADALVAAAAEVVPGLPGAVVVREVATPLTYLYWGHRSEGSVAGWSWRSMDQPKPWARSLAITPVQGLLMVGLQSFSHLFYGGMGTSIYSGRYAADLVLSGSRT
jgi:all-trans-retinol 13,14-reductase